MAPPRLAPGPVRHVAGDKPPLLLLNGMAVSSRAWPTPWLERLEQSFRLVLMDNRGTGGAGFDGAPFSMADLAYDAAGVIDGSGHEAVDVLGHSMGAMIALALAIEHPERVRRLVVVAAPPGGSATVGARPEVLSQMLSLPVDGTSAEERLRLVNPGWAQRQPDLLATVAAGHAEEHIDPRLIGMQVRAMAAVDPGRLAEVSASTLVLHGDADPIVPLENGRRVADAVTGARLEILPGMGHHVLFQAMEPCVRLVEAFLTSRS